MGATIFVSYTIKFIICVIHINRLLNWPINVNVVNNFAAPYCFLGNYLQDHRPQFGNLQKYTAKVGQDH